MDNLVLDIGVKPQQKRKVLIVDDDVHMRSILWDYFHDDYSVLSAKNAQDGVVMAKSEHPDVIIMEVMMPHLNGGYDVVKLLNSTEATHSIPIILMSATDFDLTMIDTFNHEANVARIIHKPIKMSELKVTLESTIEKK